MQRTKQKAQARTMGLQSQTKSFATAEQSAYPIRLSKMIAMVIVRSLIRLGIQCNPETLQPVSLQALQRAATGAQSRSSRKLRFRISGNDTALPNANIFQRLREDVTISAAPHKCLPKGSKLLAITPADKAATGDETLVQPEIFRVNSPMDESQCMVQT